MVLNSRTAVLLVSLLLVAGAAPGGAGVVAADSFVAVSADAPAFPTPERPFDVTVTLSNADDSTDRYDLSSLTVRTGDSKGSKKVGSVRPGPNAIDPGETATRSVEVTLNDTGRQTLYVHAVLEDESGEERRVVQPVTVDVYGDHPQVAVSTGSSSGESRPMRVTVSNGLPAEIRQVSVAVESDDVTVEEDSRVKATVGAGEEATFTFTASADTQAVHPVDVRLAYTTADGERRTVTQALRADFAASDPPAEHPQVAVDTESAVPGAWRPLTVTVSNGMDSNVRQVSVSVGSDDVQLRESRRVTPTVESGTQQTFTYQARVDSAGTYPVTVTLEYTDADGQAQTVTRTVTADFNEPDNPGRISLTGVSSDRTGDSVSISGSAANLGGDAVQSVVVSVADADGVQPAQPQPEYFVGTVEGSDFVTFDLNAKLTNNRTSVPITFTYVVDGVTRSATTSVSVGSGAPATPAGNSGGSGGLTLVGGAGLLIVLLGGVWWYRR